jgi:hypothetical protein
VLMAVGLPHVAKFGDTLRLRLAPHGDMANRSDAYSGAPPGWLNQVYEGGLDKTPSSIEFY